MSDRSNIQQITALNVGDEVAIQARELTSEAQPFGTGYKVALTVTLMRGEETQQGMGGFGQHVSPNTERAINSNDGSTHGGVTGEVLGGGVSHGFNSSVGMVTGSAPCWNCDPQPGYGYAATGKMAGDAITQTDYESYDKPEMSK